MDIHEWRALIACYGRRAPILFECLKEITEEGETLFRSYDMAFDVWAFARSCGHSVRLRPVRMAHWPTGYGWAVERL